jgi:hypothetical protein
MVSGLVAFVFATGLSELMHVEPVLLRIVGVGVFGFGLAILWIARAEKVDLRLARLVILSDVVWVAAAAFLIFGFPDVMSASGRWLLIAVSGVVGVLAGLQWRGVRRASGAIPRSLVTEIEIEATPECVWDVLTDLSEYHKWNPFILAGSGQVEVGDRIEVRIAPPEGSEMTFRPVVTEATRPMALEWLGTLGVRGLFDGRHRFELQPVVAGTRLIHSEEFTGVLAPVVAKLLHEKTKLGFEAMNAAMKNRVEAKAHRPV